MQRWEKKLKLSRQCGSLCINMKEKCKLYLFSYGHKLCTVNLINAIVCKKSSFKVDIRQNKKICYFMTPVWTQEGIGGGGGGVNLTDKIDSPYMG